MTAHHTDPRILDFFAPDIPLTTARAPGRLDVMGGIADYSGATVLELPLDCATTVRLQRQAARRCELATLRGAEWQTVRFDRVPAIRGTSEAAALRDDVRHLSRDPWPAYVLGVIGWCRAHAGAGDEAGFRIAIESSVPEGKGVASSAALEVAVMRAVLAATDRELEPAAIAAACQWVENHVVGAPCGIMDQMTSTCGRRFHLLRLRCQPAIIEGHVPVPDGYRLLGIDSGERHAVTGADYGTVRAAAFMGRRMIAESAGRDGYLANIPTDAFASRFEGDLPERMRGADFLTRYGGTADDATRVDPAREYPVRVATAFPVHEHSRVVAFAALLDEMRARPDAAREAGALMVASHAGYRACGLGSEGTDRLVEMVMREGPERGLFGAKTTGGGSGGTVAVLARADAEPLVRRIAGAYQAETGRGGAVLAA